MQHKGDAIVAGIARVLFAGKILRFSDANDSRGYYIFLVIRDGVDYWSIHIDIHECCVFWTIPCFSPASIAQSSCVCVCVDLVACC